jgi:GT2 family glycosyltransferase
VPRLSVIVPAHNAASLLPDTIAALRRSTLSRDAWELLVVDDASTDATAALATALGADRVITLPPPARGPGGARNAAATAAGGEWLVFIDADVRVHADTLERFDVACRGNHDLVAVFGSYDASPAARGLLSEYRNLLHRYVHLRGAGNAETFWAGCGAVRRDAFRAVDGFDTARFPRPQIEDIELGYRLRDRGGRILLDPSIQATHLKRWRFWQMVRTDVRDRGIPWTRLLLERRGRTAPTLNTGAEEQLKVAGAALGAVTLAAALAFAQPWLALVGVALLAMVAILNRDTFAWFARQRGPLFALATVPLNLLYYLGNAVAAAVGVLLHLVRGPLPSHAGAVVPAPSASGSSHERPVVRN